MYNNDFPTRAELPTTKQLIRSTVIAILAAVAILIAIVLPSEYAIDPTGIGRGLGLTEMGEIKIQLAREAEEDLRGQKPPEARPERRSSLGDILGQFFIRSAAAQAAAVARRDEMSITLKPDEGAEVKLEMKAGRKANYVWTSTGKVNFDLHADGEGNSTSYKKGRSVTKDEGVLTAAFDGNHGWFWRNRGKTEVTVTLRANGDYAAIKRAK